MLNKKNKVILTDSNILITGGAGFIGSNLVEKLILQNNNIKCLDNFSTGKVRNIEAFLNNPNFQLIEGDIRNADTCDKACRDIDIVLHHAALGSVPRSIDDPVTTNEVNIDGFLNMIVAARNNKVKRFIYAASSSTYGDSTELPKVEDKIGSPLSPYAVTKYVNELYAKVFGELYGLETIGLRYFNVFGKNQDPDGPYAAVFPKFIKSLLNHQPPLIHGDGTQSRDFTYIANVVQANELAAVTTNKMAINKVFNVAFGESNSLKQLTEKIISGLSAYDPEIADIEPVYGPERMGDIKDSLASIENAKIMLGYDPQYNVLEGLDIALEWYYNDLK